MASPIDYTGNDRLLNAMRYRESVENRIHRAEQTEIQWNGLMLEQERNELGKIEAQRRQDQDRLEIQNKTRAENALKESTLKVAEIDVSTPEGEKELGKWMSYARANGVDDNSMRTTFGHKLNELGVIKEAKIREDAEALGSEGLSLFESFREMGVSSNRARDLASQSSQARQTLAAWQKYAEEKGVPLVLDENDYASIKKRVGSDPKVQIADGSFDPRPAYYDLEAVNQVIAKKLTPELAKMVKQETDAAARKAREDEANISLKLSQGKEAEANAVKATFEAGVYNKAGTPGAASPERTPSPASTLFP